MLVHLEVHLAFDAAVVFPLRLVEYHADPFARRERRVADVGDDALALLHGDLDALPDFEWHLGIRQPRLPDERISRALTCTRDSSPCRSLTALHAV